MIVTAQDTYLDNFNLVSYANNNGSQNFTTNWVETNDNNNPANGNIRITTNRLEFRRLPNEYITRTLDLSSATSVTLTFDYAARSGNSNERYLRIQLYNSVLLTYETIAQLRLDTSGSFSYSLNTNQISANSGIRFMGGIEDWEDPDLFYIDNVLFSANSGPSNVITNRKITYRVKKN
ncbi:MAG: hypothetical protein MUO53_14230 [Maribacter sp.]|nr:hypothetical protein [Maribacter sp.]